MPEVGAYAAETLTVDPHDESTAVALVVTAPGENGAVTTPAATSSDGGATWVAVVQYTAAGVWRLLWTVTGTGAGVRSLSVVVDAAFAAPPWAPDGRHVASYIPHRTVNKNTSTATDQIVNVFDATTSPTGVQVARLIADGCAWVLGRCGPVDASLWPLATAVAAIWTAAMIERSYPTNPNDVATADSLEAQANDMLDKLALANETITGDDPDDPDAHLLPIGYFPKPAPWGDDEFQ